MGGLLLIAAFVVLALLGHVYGADSRVHVGNRPYWK